MKLLAIDTSMQACSAAIYDGAAARLLAGRLELMDRGHAEAIAPMVNEVLKESHLSPEEISRIAVTVGPGSFTGVRTGLAMARGLGLALGIPVVGVNTLQAVSWNTVKSDEPLLVAIDARRNEIYAALFDPSGAEILAPAVYIAETVQSILPDGSVNVVGSAADSVIAASNRTGLRRGSSSGLPDASAFVHHAASIALLNVMPSPLYLRGADAKRQSTVGRRAIPVFRIASPFEAPLFAALHAECFGKPWSGEDFARLMATPGALSIIAEERDQPLGFAVFRRAADEAEILTIGTTPDARRRGMARALINQQSETLSAMGVASLFIEVAQSNVPAFELYKSCGFQVSGRRKDYYEREQGEREDAIIMRKDIGL